MRVGKVFFLLVILGVAGLLGGLGCKDEEQHDFPISLVIEGIQSTAQPTFRAVPGVCTADLGPVAKDYERAVEAGNAEAEHQAFQQMAPFAGCPQIGDTFQVALRRFTETSSGRVVGANADTVSIFSVYWVSVASKNEETWRMMSSFSEAHDGRARVALAKALRLLKPWDAVSEMRWWDLFRRLADSAGHDGDGLIALNLFEAARRSDLSETLRFRALQDLCERPLNETSDSVTIQTRACEQVQTPSSE